MDKEFGKLSRQQLREFYAHYHGAGTQKSELLQVFKTRESRFRKILTLVGSWGEFYELRASTIVLLFMHVTGLLPAFQAACLQDDPQQGVLDFLDSPQEFIELSDDLEAMGFVLFMAQMGNFQASISFGQSISDMVQRVASGDDEALFKAVRTDRAVLYAEPIAQRIALAQVLNDNAFMDRLAKAVTQTKPARPKPDLDDSRFLLGLLDDAIGLQNIANKTVDELIADDLQAISGSNTFDRISKLLTQFRQMSRK